MLGSELVLCILKNLSVDTKLMCEIIKKGNNLKSVVFFFLSLYENTEKEYPPE